jgi:hypothetical protein
VIADATDKNLFNRAPDPVGEAYWATQLQTGASTVGGAIINIISGAQANDLVTINNKVTVGDRAGSGNLHRTISGVSA